MTIPTAGTTISCRRIVNQSATSADMLTGTGTCGSGDRGSPGVAAGTAHAQGRCGYGPRLPLLVISPFAKPNFVDHTHHRSKLDPSLHRRQLAERRTHRQGSFDAIAGPLDNMFDFEAAPNTATLILRRRKRPTGQSGAERVTQSR